MSDADPARTRRSHPAWEWTRARWWKGSAARTHLRTRRCRTVVFDREGLSLISFRTRISAWTGYRVFPCSGHAVPIRYYPRPEFLLLPIPPLGWGGHSRLPHPPAAGGWRLGVEYSWCCWTWCDCVCYCGSECVVQCGNDIEGGMRGMDAADMATVAVRRQLGVRRRDAGDSGSFRLGLGVKKRLGCSEGHTGSLTGLTHGSLPPPMTG